MVTNQYERDFEDQKNLDFPGRFDFKLLQNKDDIGDGNPGFQTLIRNWIKYYLNNGVEQDIDMNNNGIDYINNFDINGNLDVQGVSDFHDNIDIDDNNIEDIRKLSFYHLDTPVGDYEGLIPIYFDKNGNLIAIIDNKLYPITSMLSYGFFGGGNASLHNVIDYIDVTTTSGDASDRGDLTEEKRELCGVSANQYGFFCGGSISGSPYVIDVIEYIDVNIISGNAVDSGDLTSARYRMAGVSNGLYGFCLNGTDLSYSYLDTIDYFDVTTVSTNALDGGTTTIERRNNVGVNGKTYGFVGGGEYSGGYVDDIEYIDMTSLTGNGSDKGDLTAARYSPAGISAHMYGFFCGGLPLRDTIDYIDMTTTTGNATDRGDLSITNCRMAGVVGDLYGFVGGGYHTTARDIIDYFDITILTGNVLDKGDLTIARYLLGGVS